MDKKKFIILLSVFFSVAIAFSSSVTAANNTSLQDAQKIPDPWNTRTGTTYTTIQAAINDAQPGDTIIAETGTYTENIQINKPITLKAQGTPTIKAQDTSQATITITTDNTTITGFTITNSIYHAGIYLQNAKNCKITNNNITNNPYCGIHLYNSSNNKISNNKITKNGNYGIYLPYSSNNIISNNTITNNTYGIFLSSSNNTISNNTITNNTYGIWLRYSSNNKISNNKITNNKEGIYLEDSSNNTISNTITNNTYGIYLYYSLNNTISNNNINNNEYDGIKLYYSSNNTITNNNINNNTYGISGMWSSNNTIHNNNKITNNNIGIDLWYSSNKNIISNNNINNNNAGIQLVGSSNNNTISNNGINSNTGSGIYLSESDNNTIYNNNINNHAYGIFLFDSSIYLKYSSNNTISNNSITNNKYGIFLRASSNNKISNNKINNNNVYGIFLFDSSNKNIISNNNIKYNTNGIILNESNNNKVYRNSFISNTVQAKNHGTGNLFNLTKPTGGNYWSDYTGTDLNDDGFGDTPYTFTGGQDNLPLIPQPKITNISPANGTVSVPSNKTIIITFNQNILKGPGYANITVKMANGTAKVINKTISGNKLYISSINGWNPGVTFAVTIPANAIKNSAGSMLTTTYTSKFTAAIKINSISPANGTVSVPSNKTIIITFNQNILKGPGYANITVKMANGTAKALNKTITGNKLYISSINGWNPGVTFAVTIPANAVKNSAGSMLATTYTSKFTAAIKINSISPANGTVSVPSNKTIIITFNQNILKGPGYANITVKMANGTAKALNKTITGNKLYISSINGWNPGVKFTITIPKNAIKNSIGSMLASDFKSSFTAAR